MIRRKLRRVLAAGAIVVGALLVPAGAALAQDDTYPTPSSTPTTPSSVGGSSTQVDVPADPGGTLPVTGGQLAGLTLAGLGVTGVGVALVVLARRPQRARAQA
jgi:hypothetical protein